VEFGASGGEMIEFSPPEMLDFIRDIQQSATVRPRTYWCEFPFYIVISNAKKHFCFGCRPEDLAHLDTIEQKAWKKHKAHVNRLDRFPLEKAEYLLRLKEAHGVNTVRGLSKLTGENWFYTAKILRILTLPESIKDFIRSNKNAPSIVKFFNLRRLLDIVRHGEEKLQLARFREFMELMPVS
jgi:hypothetical protein